MSLQKIFIQHEPKPENLLKVIKEIQKNNKMFGEKECERVAQYFSVSTSHVWSLASFFDEIQVKHSRKKIIRVCSGGPCLMEKSAQVVRQLEILLGVSMENDSHPKYKLEYMSCRGLCDQGPVVMIDEQIFERVQPEMVDDVIRNYL